MTDPNPPAQDEVTYETAELDGYPGEWEEPTQESLPRRPRRRLVTPVGIALIAVALAAAGFVGGVEVQKAQGGTGAGSQARTAFAGGAGAQGRSGGAPGGAFGGSSGGSGGPTIGTVSSTKGRTLYVEDSNGTTVKVKLGGQAKITRSAKAKAGAIHPGDTVVIQGTKNSRGTVTAASVSATSSNARSSGTGGFPGGGFGAPSGASNNQGSAGGFPGGAPPAGFPGGGG